MPGHSSRAVPSGRPNPGAKPERFNPATLAGPPILVRLNFGGQTRTVQPGRPNAASLRLPIPGTKPERFHPDDPTRGPNPNGSTRPPMPGHPFRPPLRLPIPGTKSGRFHPDDPTRVSSRPPLPGHPSWCGSTSGAKPRAVQPGHPFRAAIAGPPILGAQTVGHPGDLPGGLYPATPPGRPMRNGSIRATRPGDLYRGSIVSRMPPPA